MKNLLTRGLILGAFAVACMTPLAAHADYGGQGPIKPWGAIIHHEAQGILTQETQAMDEAFHGHLSTNPHDRCLGGVYEATDVANGYRTPDERMAQGSGKTTIPGSPAPLVMEPKYPGIR